MVDHTVVCERPILFSAPMVRALLNDSKIQTRRVVKLNGHDGLQSDHTVWRYLTVDSDRMEGEKYIWQHRTDIKRVITEKCPYGKPGDQLWVRESFYQFGHWESIPDVKTKTGRMKWKFVADTTQIVFDPSEYGLEQFGPIRKGRHHKDPSTSAWHKRLGRFMPKKASRITLEITEIRVQRLQDISEEDAVAEGIVDHCDTANPRNPYRFTHVSDFRGYGAVELFETAREAYRKLWESINGLGSWDKNPWIFAISFSKS